jgi:trehalose 6-phosphate synthase/phosphatase
MLAETELRAFRGDKIVEVRPAWANKGEAFDRIIRAASPRDFLFAAGDDRTDEDLFEHMPKEAWTVHVGAGSTRAGFVVPDVQSLRRVLEVFPEPAILGKAS